MFRKIAVIALAAAWLFASVPAFAQEHFMLTFKGKVSVNAIAQVMANRIGARVEITRAKLQIRSRVAVNSETKVQKFMFNAIIGGKHEARCAFVRTLKGDGIACRSNTIKLKPIRINWKQDLLK